MQINVFAVWPLRLDRKYTMPERKNMAEVSWSAKSFTSEGHSARPACKTAGSVLTRHELSDLPMKQ